MLVKVKQLIVEIETIEFYKITQVQSKIRIIIEEVSKRITRADIMIITMKGMLYSRVNINKT